VPDLFAGCGDDHLQPLAHPPPQNRAPLMPLYRCALLGDNRKVRLTQTLAPCVQPVAKHSLSAEFTCEYLAGC
jgi:hypothetical protein